MTLSTLQKLCQKKEGQKLEFKTSTANLRAAFETLCAFLNASGGTVLIGVKDDGKIVGQPISDQTRRDIANETIELTARQQAVLDILSKEALNSIEITQQLKIPANVRTIQMDLKKLENAGKVRRKGDTRSTLWIRK